MVAISRIKQGDLEFPDTEQALSYPNGLLAVGGDLGTNQLLQAYRRGIFPWYEEPQPVLWWSPDPRSVLFPAELRISRSLRKNMRRNHFRITSDRAFQQVLCGCAAPRHSQRGTWITDAMVHAYMALHRAGYAHSMEVWNQRGMLVGGLYGIALGRVFFGESMFNRATDASKVALVALRRELGRRGLEIVDCQVESTHLNSLGARNIARLDFEQYLPQTPAEDGPNGAWALDIEAGELV